jgi:SagB-type dehydrogenase family enzyme
MPINLLTGSIDPMHSSLVRLKLRSRARLHDMTATRANVLEQVNADSSIPKGVKDAIAKLASSGSDIGSMRRICINQSGAVALPTLQLLLESLCRRSMIEAEELLPSGAPAISVNPVPLELVRAIELQCYPVIEGDLVLSRYVVIRPQEGCWFIESPCSQAVIVLRDHRMFGLLSELARPRAVTEVCKLAEVVSTWLFPAALMSTGMLKSIATEPGHESEALWDYHDLLFHTRSRRGRHDYAYGGTFRGRGSSLPPNVIMPITHEKPFTLHEPDLNRLKETDLSFTEVMETRRSTRSFGETPLKAEQLGEFLFRCCRTKQVFGKAGEWEIASKPYPAGGAIHELEVYPLIHDCQQISPGLHYYHPKEHVLYQLSKPNENTKALLEDSWYSLGRPTHRPSVLFLITARFDRVFWKYETMGYALTLKNLGVLYQTMYLVSTAMGLASCAIGGGDSDLFARASGRPYYREGSIGEFALGTL